MCHEDVIAASNGEIQTMRKTLLAIAATGLLMTAAPVFAQDVGVSVGGSGVTVGVGRDRDRDYRRGDRYDRRVYRSTDGRSSGCSEVTVKKRMPDGTVIIKKSERC